MKTMPDYSLFHVHELEDRLKTLDRENDQVEIQEIQKWIDRGGYQFPVLDSTVSSDGGGSINRKAVSAKFHDKKFIILLSLMLLLLILWNFFVLIFFGLTLAVIPIVFEAVIIYCLYVSHPKSRLLIKLWAASMMVSGFTGLLASVIHRPLISDLPWVNLLYLIAGFYVWRKANQSIEIVGPEVRAGSNPEGNI